MTEERLDLDRLQAQTIPLQVLLFLSAAVGVAAGVLLLFLGTAIGLAFVPGGIVAILGATIAAGVYGVQLLFLGIAAMVLIPVGAVVAAHLKLLSLEAYLLEESRAEIIEGSDRSGTVVADMALRAGLTQPPLYGFMDEDNAYALSAHPGAALVLMGRPLEKILTAAQVRAIIGHELGHIAMGDSRRKLLAAGHQEFLVVFLGFAGLRRVGRWTFGIIGELALAAYSREREFWADAVGAYLTSTEDMIGALRELERAQQPVRRQASLSAALKFKGAGGNLFSTHPTMQARIKMLEEGTYLRRLPVRAVTTAPEAVVQSVVYDGI